MNAVPHDDPELGTQPLPLQRPAVAAAAAAVSDEQRTLSQMQETLNAEFNRMGTSAKLYLPFFVLLLLKFLLGHVLTGVLVIAVLSSMTQIRNALNTQLSLKSQMNIKALSYMATCTALLIIAYATCMGNRLGYSEHLSQRLLFVYAVTESNDQSFWMVVWNCWLVDLFVQMALLLVKQLVCVGFASQHLQRPRGWCQACHVGARECWEQAVKAVSSASSSSTHQQQQHIGAASAADVRDIEANLPVVRPGLVSRRPSGGSATATADDDTSDTSDCGETDHMLARRICNLLDIFGLLYRTSLPVPLWVDYLGGGSISGVFPVAYIALKLTDYSWKLRGTAEAVEYFLGRKLEYGHHASAEEYDERNSTHDCPICFDRPKQAVALDCQHVFCETCIGEWLEKEKTCPVCRAEVTCAAASLDMIKKEALGFNHIVI